MFDARICEKSNEPSVVLGSRASMPSMNTLVCLALVPRMNTSDWPPGPPVCKTIRPGTSWSTSGRVRRCFCAMSSAVITVTLLAT